MTSDHDRALGASTWTSTTHQSCCINHLKLPFYLWSQSNTLTTGTLNALTGSVLCKDITYFNKTAQASSRATAVINPQRVYMNVRVCAHVYKCDDISCLLMNSHHSSFFLQMGFDVLGHFPSAQRTFIAFLIMQVYWGQMLSVFVYLIPKIYLPLHFFFFRIL